LIVIAERIGLPASEAKKVLVERQFQEAVDADWQRSRELGITGVLCHKIDSQIRVMFSLREMCV